MSREQQLLAHIARARDLIRKGRIYPDVDLNLGDILTSMEALLSEKPAASEVLCSCVLTDDTCRFHAAASAEGLIDSHKFVGHTDDRWRKIACPVGCQSLGVCHVAGCGQPRERHKS